jgi:hypothetical protein
MTCLAAAAGLGWWLVQPSWFAVDPGSRGDPGSGSAVAVPDAADSGGANHAASEEKRAEPPAAERAHGGAADSQQASTRDAIDHKALAAQFGFTYFGALDPSEREQVADRIAKEFEGCFERINKLDGSRPDDYKKACNLLVNILKYQQAGALLDRGEYLTVESAGVWKNVDGYSPLMFFGAAQVNGRSVGVLFPIERAPDSELAIAEEIMWNATAMHVDAVCSEFNAQDLGVREAKIRTMIEAQAEVSRLMESQRRGEISRAEMVERVAPLLRHRPPPGSRIDQSTMTLVRV